MKKIFTYMTLIAAVVLTACSENEGIASVSSSVISDASKVAGDNNFVAIPIALHEENWEGNVLSSKSTLYYDYSTGGVKFSWVVDDQVGVYPLKDGETVYPPSGSLMQPWTIHHVKNTENTSIGIFDIDDEHITGYPGKSYIAVSPLILDDKDYTDIPITYEGQKQSVSSEIGTYLKYLNGGTAEQLETYIESEKDACAHLAKYDYLVDRGREATEPGNKIQFEMSRLGAEIRFLLKVPSKIVFDSLQLYNASKKFVHTTTLNASTAAYAAIPTYDSHVASLQLGDFGFDYYKSTEDDEYYYPSINSWVMTAYMMMAPINLSEAETENSTLYLIGREPHFYANVDEYNAACDPDISADEFNNWSEEQKMKVYTSVDAFNTAKGLTGGDALNETQFNALSTALKMSEYTRKVYKASSLAKKNIQKAYLYQWSQAGNIPEDTPITFKEITIQQWAEGPGFTNDDGAGTADW